MRLHARSTAPAAADARVDSQIVWFVVLAFGSSWAWLVPVALTAAPVSAGVGWPTHVPALFGPMLAAFVVTATREGRVAVVDLLGRMGRFRVPMRWWLFALSPLLVLLFVLVVDLVAGRPLPDSRDFATFSGLPASSGPWGVGTVLLLLALGEETGWRGYLLPRLQQQVSPLMATVVVAAVWALWHAPMF